MKVVVGALKIKIPPPLDIDSYNVYYSYVPHIKGSRNPDRDKKIVDLLENLEVPITLQSVGDKFGLTRERVRQIYKRETGKKYHRRVKYRTAKRKADREAYLEEVKFYCTCCGEPVKRSSRRSRLCDDCALVFKQGKNPHITVTCEQCKEPFHPNRRYEYNDAKPRFCSVACCNAAGATGRPSHRKYKAKKRNLFHRFFNK